MRMHPFLRGWPQIGLACALVLLHGHSVAQTDERAILRQERAQLDAALRLAETACQQRFAVEDCLRAERRKVRQAKDVLRARENQLDLQERRERAAQRLQSIEARQREHLPTGEVKAPQATPKSAAVPEKRRTSPPLAVIRAERQSRQQEAAQRAMQAQQQQRERQAAAQAHKQQVLREQAERAQKGQPAAAPLPVPQ